VKSGDRPVPLEYAYSEIPLAHTIEKLVDEAKTPVYVVHFTQADAAGSVQDFTSLKICSREQKAEIAARLEGFAFNSPYGGDLRKWLRHGIGLHHAGLLPKYRVLVEQTGASRAAESDLRHRHARRWHQRADSHGVVHAVVQVRRPEDRPPERAGISPDRRAGRA